MESRGRGRRGHPQGASQAPPVFNQQAFVEAVGVAAAAIAQACAIVSQGKSNDLQHLEAHHPPMTIEGGLDDIRGIQDMGACTRGRKIHLFLTWERSRRLLFRTALKDKTKVIRTKARMGHLVKQGR